MSDTPRSTEELTKAWRTQAREIVEMVQSMRPANEIIVLEEIMRRLAAARAEGAREAQQQPEPHMAAGLMVWLKEECEKQHARAEAAESALSALEAAHQRLREMSGCHLRNDLSGPCVYHPNAEALRVSSHAPTEPCKLGMEACSHSTVPCVVCGEGDCKHGPFGFRDHAYRPAETEPTKE